MANNPADSELHAMRIRKLNQDIADAKRLDISHRFMHISALAPNSRDEHVARHGELFTGPEMLEWWGLNDNDVGCRCAAIMVLTDEAGNPRTPVLISRAKSKLESHKNRAK
ncbi:hypothetical protein [Pseudomonas sp. GL-RE-26]|uniref:hypothetical protein n=1 Tax=Pseudomonas sp. GL-RE-26 TaxID=2832390 RepID=UPI002958A0DC|nr:hypothetical protein [Pseudomonas sp. GL-RE-26]